MNILVVKPSSLGDIVHTFPAVALLRQQFPEATITWVVNDVFSGIVESMPEVDEIVLFHRRRLGNVRHWPEIVGFLHELRQRRADIAIDFQGLLRSGLIAYLSGAPRRIGFRNAREGATFFYSEKVPLPANLKHAQDKNVFLVRSAFGITAPLPPTQLASGHDFAKCARRLFKEHGLDRGGPILAVAPGTRWESKAWPPACFAAVIDEAARRIPTLHCWLLGTEDEKTCAKSVAAACTVLTPSELTGATNMGTLIEMLRRSDVLLTNDSGPMHVAAALGMPTVSIFGPTDPELTGPWGEGHVVFTGECERRPCFAKTCPLGTGNCMERIAVDNVVAAIENAIRARRQSRGGSARTLGIDESRKGG